MLIDHVCVLYRIPLLKLLNVFLSHLLIGGCEIGVFNSVHSFIHLSVCILRIFALSLELRSIASKKACIVNVHGILFRRAP